MRGIQVRRLTLAGYLRLQLLFLGQSLLLTVGLPGHISFTPQVVLLKPPHQRQGMALRGATGAK